MLKRIGGAATYCYLMVDGVKDSATGVNPTVGQGCASSADARDDMAQHRAFALRPSAYATRGGRSSVAPSTIQPQATRTLGFAWTDAGPGGTSMRLYVFYLFHDPGDCDKSGYSINTEAPTGTTMSAITGSGACNTARLTNDSNENETVNLPNSYVGDRWNDKVAHIQIFNH